MKHLRILAIAATALVGAATAASAQEAFTTNDVAMRAGPGTRYPVVRMLPEDARVYIHGCLSNWDWCDVSWRRSRGWVFSDYLEALYRNRRVDFDAYRGYVDIPFVTFGFGYWDRYYRDRPWFDNWDRWGDRNDRRWRHYRDSNGDWNNDGDRGDWNRNRDRNNNQDANSGDDNGDNTTRRDRRNDNGDERTRCTPDDPSCYGANDDMNGSGNRRHRSQQQMDQQQTDQQQ